MQAQHKHVRVNLYPLNNLGVSGALFIRESSEQLLAHRATYTPKNLDKRLHRLKFQLAR